MCGTERFACGLSISMCVDRSEQYLLRCVRDREVCVMGCLSADV